MVAEPSLGLETRLSTKKQGDIVMHAAVEECRVVNKEGHKLLCWIHLCGLKFSHAWHFSYAPSSRW